jgi:hypothetical protein
MTEEPSVPKKPEKIDVWLEKAKANKGSPVIWINQSDNKELKEIDSEGVCFVITLDWVNQYRSNRIARSQFVNAFRDGVQIDPKTGQPDPNTCIPIEYMISQSEYSSRLRRYRQELAAVMKKLEEALAKKLPIAVDVASIQDAFEAREYGPGMKQVSRFRKKDGKTIADAVKAMQANTDPAYYMLVFHRPGGGHVVGFEFRPDVVVSENFPGLFEFIDANLGLYAFPASDNMLAFFNNCVWAELYAARPYNSFDLVRFDLGAGGF